MNKKFKYTWGFNNQYNTKYIQNIEVQYESNLKNINKPPDCSSYYVSDNFNLVNGAYVEDSTDYFKKVDIVWVFDIDGTLIDGSKCKCCIRSQVNKLLSYANNNGVTITFGINTANSYDVGFYGNCENNCTTCDGCKDDDCTGTPLGFLRYSGLVRDTDPALDQNYSENDYIKWFKIRAYEGINRSDKCTPPTDNTTSCYLWSLIHPSLFLNKNTPPYSDSPAVHKKYMMENIENNINQYRKKEDYIPRCKIVLIDDTMDNITAVYDRGNGYSGIHVTGDQNMYCISDVDACNWSTRINDTDKAIWFEFNKYGN